MSYAPSPLVGEGAPLNWCPSAVADAGNGWVRDRGSSMDFYAVLDQVVALLRQRQRVTYRALKVQFQLDDEALEALRDELIEAQHLATDEAGRVLVWTGDTGSSPAPAQEPVRAPHTYTPPHLAEKILTSRSALTGERKQVTVLFADLKSSMELLADRDPEEARQLL